ncbi:MAG: ATP-binding protein [Pseudomonadota bacterium]
MGKSLDNADLEPTNHAYRPRDDQGVARSGRALLRGQGDMPVPLWLSLPALTIGTAFGYLAAVAPTGGETLVMLMGAATAGGLGFYGLLERALLRQMAPTGHAVETFLSLYQGAPEATALVDTAGRVRALNAAGKASVSRKIRLADELLQGAPDAAAQRFQLLRDATKGRTRHTTLHAPGRTVVDVSVWPGPEGFAIWRWRVRDNSLDADALTRAAEQAGLGWFRSNAEGQILEMNAVLQAWVRPPASHRRIGRRANGAPQHLSAIVPEAARRLIGGAADQTIQRTKLVGGTGAPRTVSLLYAPLRNRDGQSGEAIGLLVPASKPVETANIAPLDPAQADTTVEKVLDAATSIRLFEDAPIGVAVLSPEGRIWSLNAAASRLLGGAAGTDDALLDAISEEDREEAIRRLTAISVDGAIEGPAFEATIGKSGGLTLDGEPTVAQFYFNRIQTARGPALLTYMVDASDERAMEERFRQSQRLHAVGVLAGGIAHDFNNILQVISGCSEELLARHSAGDPDFMELDDIYQSAQRAKNLVSQLLAFSRKQTLQLTVTDLTDQLSDLSHMLDRLIGEKATLYSELTEDVWPVRVDVTQFDQVISNLVVNASHAIRDGGKGKGQIVIRTRNEVFDNGRPVPDALMPPGPYVCIEVADNGCGIPQDKLDQIFEPFYTTKQPGEGTGLGLSTAYGIIKQTGGFIFPDSEVGAGTTFRIFLPRYEAVTPVAVDKEGAKAQALADLLAPAARSTSEPERRSAMSVIAAAEAALGASPALSQVGEAPARTHGTEAAIEPSDYNILLVEDEAPLRQMVARMLRAAGYQVAEACDGEEALEILKDPTETVDLMLSDVIMPNIDGPTLMLMVREMRQDLKTIFMSGYPRDAFDTKFANDIKADEPIGYIQKPFKLAALRETVKETLTRTNPH